MKRVIAVTLISLLAAESNGQGFDTNSMESFAARLYDRIDLDHDGELTMEEYELTQGGGFPVDYQMLDLDSDGVVTKSEYLLAVRKFHPPAKRNQPI